MWSDKGHKGQASNMCLVKKKKNRQYIKQIQIKPRKLEQSPT